MPFNHIMKHILFEVSIKMSENPDQEEMSRKKHARLPVSQGRLGRDNPVVGEKEKASASPVTTDMEVDSQPQPSLKSGASQNSLDFDSGLESMEIETDKCTTMSPHLREQDH